MNKYAKKKSGVLYKKKSRVKILNKQQFNQTLLTGILPPFGSIN